MPSGNLYPALPGLKIVSGSVTTSTLNVNTSEYDTIAMPAGSGKGLVLAGVVDTITSGGMANFVTDGTAAANKIGVETFNLSTSTQAITVTFHAFVLPGL